MARIYEALQDVIFDVSHAERIDESEALIKVVKCDMERIADELYELFSGIDILEIRRSDFEVSVNKYFSSTLWDVHLYLWYDDCAAETIGAALNGKYIYRIDVAHDLDGMSVHVFGNVPDGVGDKARAAETRSRREKAHDNEVHALENYQRHLEVTERLRRKGFI